VSRTTAIGITFTGVPYRIDSSTILRLPPEASAQLPSRGQVAVEGSISGHPLRTVVEPDGRRGHWLRVDDPLRCAAGVEVGVEVEANLEVLEDWPEPVVPADLAATLDAAPDRVRAMWQDITPMARWEWVRWVNATANAATRQRRVEVTISKMEHGKRRPCCFDLSACTDPAVSKSGKLREAP
jgi:hypothetical protein